MSWEVWWWNTRQEPRLEQEGRHIISCPGTTSKGLGQKKNQAGHLGMIASYLIVRLFPITASDRHSCLVPVSHMHHCCAIKNVMTLYWPHEAILSWQFGCCTGITARKVGMMMNHETPTFVDGSLHTLLNLSSSILDLTTVVIMSPDRLHSVTDSRLSSHERFEAVGHASVAFDECTTDRLMTCRACSCLDTPSYEATGISDAYHAAWGPLRARGVQPQAISV